MSPRTRAGRAIEVTVALVVIELALLLSGHGSVPVPSGISASIIAIPAIAAGILAGPIAGAVVGAALGVTSYLVASTPLFHDPVIAIIPRLLIGVVAAVTFSALRRAALGVALAAAAALGTAANTGLILVLATVLTSPVGAPYISPAVAWDVARTSLGYEIVIAVVVVTALGLGLHAASRGREPRRPR